MVNQINYALIYKLFSLFIVQSFSFSLASMIIVYSVILVIKIILLDIYTIITIRSNVSGFGSELLALIENTLTRCKVEFWMPVEISFLARALKNETIKQKLKANDVENPSFLDADFFH
jgi:hypothetical protein